jgi:glycosyltransferase involved in cell wall biosynthesis
LASRAAPSTWGLIGLVRQLDLSAGRHVYAAGALRDGELVGELGSLLESPGHTPVPVWIGEDGTLRTDRYRPQLPPPSFAVRALWAAAPLRCGDLLDRRGRLRAAAGRTARLVRRRPVERPVLPNGEPAGYLEAKPSTNTVPLYSAVHPITADQLVTTDLCEIYDLGYEDPVMLGHAVAAAFFTGKIGVERRWVPWASRFGQRVRTPARVVPQLPVGYVDGATPRGTLPAFVWGWAHAPFGRIARVEIEVGGRRCGSARIGLPRPDVVAATGRDDAYTSGFEFALLPGHMTEDDWGSGRCEVEIGAVAHGYRGESCRLEPLRIQLERPPEVDPDERARALTLRARTAGLVSVRPRPEPGTHHALVVLHNLGLGGAQLYMLELLARLRRRPGFRATVVSMGDGPLRDRLEALGMPVHVTAEVPLRTADLYEGKIAELAAWAAPQGFDLAIVNTLCAFPAVDAAKLLGLPTLFAIHESYQLDHFWCEAYAPGFAGPYARERGRAAIAEADAVIFEAEATRRLFLPHARDPGRLITLPYGIELEEIDEFRHSADRTGVRADLGLHEDDRLMLCLGTVEPRKSQAMLVDAFRRVADRHPEAVLALVGQRDDAYNIGVRDHVARTGLGDRLRLIPLSSDPYRWHLAADFLVCASDIESLPRVILEAMAFGVPVVTTAVYGAGDIIEDGRTGYLCRVRDGADLSQALERALSTPESDRLEMVAAALAQVRAEHEPAAYAEQVADLLDRIVAGAPVSAADGDLMAA